MWKEMKKRWLMFGVLVVMMLAVLAPRIILERIAPHSATKLFAPIGTTSSNHISPQQSGPLRTEYVWYVLLWYVYYVAGGLARGEWAARGERGARGPRPRLLVACAAHAHVVAPALCVAAVAAFRDGVDHRMVKGALVSSVGGPCAWLSLSLSRQHAAALTAANYAASLLAEPLAMFFICGRASVPPVGALVRSLATSAAPFVVGALRPRALRPRPRPGRARPELAALGLLYVDCCRRLHHAEGGLHLTHVLATLMLEVSYVGASAAWCSLYARGGVLAAHEVAPLAACAVPKALAHGWEWWGACGGVSPLPAVFLAPAQALVLAAFTDDDHDSSDDESLDGEH
ncbi:uncharacterized protein LOC131842300 [Achroia grisella]|uniref:uncharacterized protein LOC131842300 n=1 Tax=Achroia grisella TaxID=688607 RepID=UPI0027D280A9|nr:uncharacterized protein LOC131842300 [Achroia grisella]